MDRVAPRSLVRATDIDVLPLDRVVERRDGYLVVRSPSNPLHYWGNLLLFDDPPEEADVERWEALFESEFGDDPRVRHRTLSWDRPDGATGAASAFLARGYDLEESVGLVASPGDVRPHPRADRDVEIRLLDSAAGADAELWDAVVEIEVEDRDEGHEEEDYRRFVRARLADRRVLFRAGGGAWYAALDPATGAVAASCGVVVTGGRARFQSVSTAAAYRRRGICSRLVVEVARDAVERHRAERLVIVADAGYHALGLYESLGFRQVERVFGVCRWPRA